MRFEIVRFDKDYHQVVESVMMDFNNIHDAEKYCEGASGCGEEYYVKCTKQDNIKIIDELVRQTDVSSFMWRDKYGAYHNPGRMRTSYLFFVLRMIWNHVVPDKYKLFPYKQYSFSSHYTVEYMANAVKYIYKELMKRNDLEQRWLNELAEMDRSIKEMQKMRCISE